MKKPTFHEWSLALLSGTIGLFAVLSLDMADSPRKLYCVQQYFTFLVHLDIELMNNVVTQC